MADTEFIGHSNAAICLYRCFPYVPPEFSYLPLQYRNIARCDLPRFRQCGRVEQRRPGFDVGDLHIGKPVGNNLKIQNGLIKLFASGGIFAGHAKQCAHRTDRLGTKRDDGIVKKAGRFFRINLKQSL